MAILLTKGNVEQLLDMKSTIAILEQGFSELAAGQAVMPQRTGESHRMGGVGPRARCQARGRRSAAHRRVYLTAARAVGGWR